MRSKPAQGMDILVLSNGPGEVTTWVRPVVQALREIMGNDRDQVRISLVLSPCPNASGQEVQIAQTYPEIDRIQAASDFFPFLLLGKTRDQWDWRNRGVVLFLGGDQIYPVIIGKRLGYRTVIYGEWDTRWHAWIDRFAVMKPELVDRAPTPYQHKFTVVGDLMAEAGHSKLEIKDPKEITPAKLLHSATIGLLPGSKPAKLAQGLPLSLAIAQHLHAADPTIRFVIPVAPTLTLTSLVRFADPHQNSVAHYFGEISGHLTHHGDQSVLTTDSGVSIELHTEFPAYSLLASCDLCLTTVGANTAELGALAVPMLVLLPTQQLDAMRAWDGIPGLLANLPGLGAAFAKLINGWFLRRSRLLSWPNIWAGEAIVPEIVGKLQPEAIATQILDLLQHPQQLEDMRLKLRRIRGETGAAKKLAHIVQDTANQ